MSLKGIPCPFCILLHWPSWGKQTPPPSHTFLLWYAVPPQRQQVTINWILKLNENKTSSFQVSCLGYSVIATESCIPAISVQSPWYHTVSLSVSHLGTIPFTWPTHPVRGEQDIAATRKWKRIWNKIKNKVNIILNQHTTWISKTGPELKGENILNWRGWG